MEQDINKLIEELTKVRPDELSKEGLKLFNKINEIIDRNIYLVNERKKLEELLFMSNENYIEKSLIKEKIEELKNKSKYCSSDELREYSQQIQVLEELLREEK